jgi:hypothetical protein
MGTLPSLNGSNGRTTGGRFGRGNPGGPGNPFARRSAQIRSLFLESVTDDDLRAIIAKLVEMAKGGDLAAIRELLDRMLGKPLSAVAVAIAADSINEVDDDSQNLSNHSNVETLHQLMLREPDYLDYLRKKALEEDTLWCANNPISANS